jgi:3-oxoacyl-(acyl-carrier-protein) synthase
MSRRRVAVTGIGVVTGYGQGTGALWSGLSSGRSAVTRHQARMGRRAWLEYPMAALRDGTAALARSLPNQEFVKDNRLEDDRDLIVIADSVRQALADAGLSYDPDRNDVGLVVTHESPGLARHVQGFFRWGRMAKAWLRSRSRFNPPEFLYEQQSESVYRMHSFLYIHYLSALFRLHGFTLFNNNACASGAFAMAVAADRIRSGEASAIVVAGGDVPEDGTKYRWFRDRGLYSPTGECRPFAASRNGMVLGSAAAAFLFEDLETARASGRRIYAEWLGSGFTSEGWKVVLPDVVSGRYRDAMARALTSAGVRPEEVTLISPHGVGSGLYDRFEAQSLAEVFGDRGRTWPALMALKGAVGHTLGGCTLVETAASILAVEHGEVPAAGRCVDPDPALPLGRSPNDGLPSSWVLLKCTNGFAGQNGAIVLRSPLP